MAKRVNKCPSYDKHWGCAISPMKNCSGCANADWHMEDNDKSKQRTLKVGEYLIPDDCTAKFVGRTLLVYKRKSKKLSPTEYRCKNCKYRLNLYGKPCENFEKK